MKTGTKNIVAEKNSINSIETLISQYKKKRLTTDEFVVRINQSLSHMTNERDYIKYLTNIGQY